MTSPASRASGVGALVIGAVGDDTPVRTKFLNLFPLPETPVFVSLITT